MRVWCAAGPPVRPLRDAQVDDTHWQKRRKERRGKRQRKHSGLRKNAQRTRQLVCTHRCAPYIKGCREATSVAWPASSISTAGRQWVGAASQWKYSGTRDFMLLAASWRAALWHAALKMLCTKPPAHMQQPASPAQFEASSSSTLL